jgi:aspartyl-tRNA(Asn)/glutamyl-tRNA(Gln) amidotransferase subunit B
VVGIKQVQLEQDTAKTIQQPPTTHLIDFNRVSHPLIEIISLPTMHSPATAAAYVRKIQAILKSVSAAVIGMELGGLRADVNVSVRPRDQAPEDAVGSDYSGVGGLGQRTEIKNLSSFKAVEDAIIAEQARQIAVLESGGKIEGETRGWTLGSTETTRLRGKEGEVDYRYMPDPDLGPILIGEDLITHLRETLPVLPDQLLGDLTSAPYSLTVKDAKTIMLLDDGERIDYYEEVVEHATRLLSEIDTNEVGSSALNEKVGRTTGNWVLHELGGLLSTSGTAWESNPVTAESLAGIILLLLTNQITGGTAKHILSIKFDGDQRTVSNIVEEDDLLLKPMANADLISLAKELMSENEVMVSKIRQDPKQQGKIMWFVGQIVRRAGEGKVEAKTAEKVLRDLFGSK